MKVISKHDTSSAKTNEHPTDRQSGGRACLLCRTSRGHVTMMLCWWIAYLCLFVAPLVYTSCQLGTYLKNWCNTRRTSKAQQAGRNPTPSRTEGVRQGRPENSNAPAVSSPSHGTLWDCHGVPQVWQLADVVKVLAWGHSDCIAAIAQLQHRKRVGLWTLPRDVNGRSVLLLWDCTAVNLCHHLQIDRTAFFFSFNLHSPLSSGVPVPSSSSVTYSKTIDEHFEGFKRWSHPMKTFTLQK